MYKEKYVTFLMVIFLLALSLQTILFMKEKSVTADEMIFIESGYKYLKTGNLNIDDVNPPLIMIISALPLLFMNLTLEPNILPGSKGLEYGFNFLYYNQNPDQILFWARFHILILSLMLALLVFRWAKDLYGPKAGLLALFFYVFSPTIISLSGLGTVDLGSTFFILLSLYLFWLFLKNPSFSRLVITSLVVGLAFCSKHTSLMLVPSFILISLIFTLKKGFRIPNTWPLTKKYEKLRKAIFFGISSVVFIILLVATINIVYMFKDTGTPIGNLPFVEKEVFKSHPIFSKLINPYTAWIPTPLPYPFLRSIGSTLSRTALTSKWPSYLMGQFSTEGWWYYYLFAFLIKTPIPFLFFLIFSIACIHRTKHIDWFNESFLIVPILVMFFMASMSNTQIGIRHILIVYPLLFIFVSKIVNFEVKQKLTIIIAGVILGLWYVFSSVLVSPHYLAYFNEFAGGPKNGYRYLIDSNLDWGQDVKGLIKFMDQRGIDKIKFGHWIGIDPRYALGSDPG